MKQRIFNYILNNKLLLLLFTAIIFLRLYKIHEYFIFDIDVQYQTLLAWEQVKNFHIIWVGVSASNLGYYLGPGLVYLTALLLKLSSGNPLILGYFASIIGIATAASLYFVAKQLFNEKIALVALTLYGFSHFMILYDRRYWPLFIPLIAIWIYYSLVKAKKNVWWLVFAVFLISVSYHVHLSLLMFWPFLLFALSQNRRKLTIKVIGIMTGIYVFVTSPLLVFDILHNYDNLMLPLRIIQSQSDGTSSINITSSFDYLKDVISTIFIFEPASETTPLFILAGISLLLMIQSRNWQKLSQAQRYLITILAVQFVAVLLYPGPLQQYYGVLFAPFLMLISAIGITHFKPKYIIGSLALYVLLNTYTFMTQPPNSGLAVKQAFIQKINHEIEESSYRLEFDEERDFQGWRYLFQAYATTPVSSMADSQFGWIYQSEIESTHDAVVIITQNEPQLFDTKVIEGPYNAFIIRK